MNKIYQPFIIEKAEQLFEILKDEIQFTNKAKKRLCDVLTGKFINGELSSTDPINEIFDKDELIQFIHTCLVEEDLEHLKELGYINSFDVDNDEEMYFLTEKGKKYVQDDLMNGKE